MVRSRLAVSFAPLLALLVACGASYPAGSAPGGTGGGGSGGSGGTGGTGGTGGGLPALACEDPACGGSPIGTWTVVDTCPPAGFEPFPGYPDCAGEDARLDQDVSGTAEFTDEQEYFDLDGVWRIHLPMHEACLAAVTGGGMSPWRTCQQLDDSIRSAGIRGGCSWDDGERACTCDYEQPLAGTSWIRRYEVVGATLAYPDEPWTPAAGFCSRDGRLVIRREDSVFVLARQD